MRSISDDGSPEFPSNSGTRNTHERLTAIIHNMRELNGNSSRLRNQCLQEDQNSESHQNLSDFTMSIERRSLSSSGNQHQTSFTSAYIGLGSQRIANSSEERLSSFRNGIMDGSETAAAFFENLPQESHPDYRTYPTGPPPDITAHFNPDRIENQTLPESDRIIDRHFSRNNYMRNTANHAMPNSHFSNATNQVDTNPTASILPFVFTGKVNSWKDRTSPFIGNSEILMDDSDPAGYVLELIVTTWSRDSHDLFDYEAPADKISAEKISIVVSRININHTQLLCRLRYEVLNQNAQPTISTRIVVIDTMEGPLTSLIKAHLPRGVQRVQAEVLIQIDVIPIKFGLETYYKASLQECHSRYFVQQPEIIVSAKPKLFQIIRDADFKHKTELPQITLKEDVVIKLGRYPVKIKQLVARGDQPVPIKLTLLEADEEAILRAKVLLPCDSIGVQCRICLCEGSEIGDPLLSACACRGSIQYIHATCLKYWFKNSQESQTANEDTANTQCHVTATNCELCKQQFPPFIDIATADHPNSELERFNLISTTPLMPPFVVFESLQPGNARMYANSLLKHPEGGLSFPLLKVGRGHESSMRIPDVSISRTHAEIFLDDEDNFVMKDLQSKFGTLLAAEEPIILYCFPESGNLDPDESAMNGINAFTRTSLQCGRSVVDCVLRNMTPREKYGAGITTGAYLDAFTLKNHIVDSDSVHVDLLEEIETNESDSRSHSSFTQ